MHVLLVSPSRDARWLSMERYAARLQLAQAGVDFSYAPASHFNPPTWLRPIIPRYRSWPPLRASLAAFADVVHVTDGPLAHHRGVFQDRPVVATCHDLIPLEHEHNFGAGIPGFVFGRVYQHATAALREYRTLITVSEATKAVMQILLEIEPSRVSVVPVAIPWQFVPVDGARERLAAAGIELPAGPLLLSVGHPGPTKNLELLIEALAQPALAGAHLVRVSARLTSAQGRRVRAAGVESRIIRPGSVSDERLVDLYSACDVLVQPSFFEGFGIPVAEAMACGLPVVASAIPALVEVTAGAAQTVELHGSPHQPVNMDDAAEFARRVASVVEASTVREEMRAVGLARAAAFRPEAVAPLLRAAYEAAIAAGPA